MHVAVLGAGAVGARAVRQLASSSAVTRVTVIDSDPGRRDAVCAAVAQPRRVVRGEVGDLEGVDVGLLASPGGDHRATAERLLEQGAAVVSTSDDPEVVEQLLAFDAEARERGVAVVAGAAFSPGLTCVLAAHAASMLDGVDEVHVARSGAGGPACARQRHRALASAAVEWCDGAWVRRPGGSGRELCWFPDPVGALDCYRGGLPEPLLLTRALPGVERVTARVAANRRDRLTARLPMLRPPHPEGGLGAVRVEVRGRRGAGRDVVVLGAIDRPAIAAGAVAALAAEWAGSEGAAGSGASGLAGRVDPARFLAELARRGVKAAIFEGSAPVTTGR